MPSPNRKVTLSSGASAQALSEIATLVAPPKTTPLEQLRLDATRLKNDIRAARRAGHDIESLTQQMFEVQRLIQIRQFELAREHMQTEASERLPRLDELVQDPLEQLMLLSDMAKGLQWRFISKEKLYIGMIQRTYMRMNEDTALQEGAMPPELEDGQISRLEEIRRQRDDIALMRFAVEQKFKLVLQDLDPDARYIPKLLTKSDEEVWAMQDSKHRERVNLRLEQQRQITAAHVAHATTERTEVLTPDQPKPALPLPKI